MFAILKDHRGVPQALLEIEHETPKRFYGTIVDKLRQDSAFWIRGLVHIHPGTYAPNLKEHYDYRADKEIVVAVIRSDVAWFGIKDKLVAAKMVYEAHAKTIERRLNDARTEANDCRAVLDDELALKIAGLVVDIRV